MDLRCDHLYCDRDRERFWPYLGGENGRYVSESASSESISVRPLAANTRCAVHQ
jgi:hypothetical protein